MNTGWNELFFDKPAIHFAEALPIGNGRLGAVIFGGREEDKIILNETGMWSGSPGKYDRENRKEVFHKIRMLLMNGKGREAELLYEQEFTSHLTAKEEYAGASSLFGCYQTLGTLSISMHQRVSAGQYSFLPQWSEEEDFYRRSLLLDEGIYRMEYCTDHVRYCREALASHPHQLIILHYTSDTPQSMTMSLRMDRAEHFNVQAENDNELLMTGYLENGEGGKGVSYACRIQAQCKNGNIYTEGNVLYIKNADEVTIRITADTDIHSFSGRVTDHPVMRTKDDLQNAQELSYENILSAHKNDYRELYGRTSFELADCEETERKKTTDKRLKEFKEDISKNDLIPLFFNYGKYLYISANRKGGFPSNLQGIWAEEIQTMFNGDWHLDAQQQNHWLAEPLNLAELHETYLNLAVFLQKSGTHTAYEYYGVKGWVAHIFTNPWGFTAPGAKTFYGAFIGGSGWICQHLWDHYLYNEDKEYLQQIYPVLKGACEFYSDILYEDPKSGWLLAGPSTSPENAYFTKDGEKISLCMGSTCDTQIIRYLFSACVEAEKILKKDIEFQKILEDMLLKLPPSRIGKDGKIMEWLEPYDFLPHRHISHLWGLYPGDEITPEKTPELAEAAWRVIENKKAATGGWALAHRMNASARLYKGEAAESFLKKMLSESLFPNMLGKCHQIIEDGKEHILPSFEEYRVPFQIDGNYACTAGIAEMLMQSHETMKNGSGETVHVVHILPALPPSWKSGKVSGLRARGNIMVSIAWKDGRLQKVTISSSSNKKIRLKYAEHYLDVTLNSEKENIYFHKIFFKKNMTD